MGSCSSVLFAIVTIFFGPPSNFNDGGSANWSRGSDPTSYHVVITLYFTSLCFHALRSSKVSQSALITRQIVGSGK